MLLEVLEMIIYGFLRDNTAQNKTFNFEEGSIKVL